MDATFTVEYNSTDAIATDFIERISLEMKKLGIFKFSNKKEKSSKSLENKTVENPLLEELEYIKKNYKDNWDGADGKALDKQVYANVKKIVSKFQNQMLNWSLVMRSNGSISLMSNDDRASVDIAKKHISFYVITKEKEKLFQRQINFDLSKNDNDLMIIDKILNLWQISK